MRLTTRLVALGAVVGSLWIAVAGTSAGAADDVPESQPSTEETGDYPLADKIYAEQGIRLIRGDGRIRLVDCASTPAANRIEVNSTPDGANKGRFCFSVKGATGFLSLELPEVFLIRADNGHDVAAKVEDAGAVETIPVPRGEWKPIKVGDDDPTGATLLELRTTS